MNTVLIDSNILIYAIDASDKEKHEEATNIITKGAEEENTIALSAQNLAELYAVSKNVSQQAREDATKLIVQLNNTNTIQKIIYTHQTVHNAIKLLQYTNDYWDALIAATMQENNIHTIITENDKDYTNIPGLHAINPFKKKKK